VAPILGIELLVVGLVAFVAPYVAVPIAVIAVFFGGWLTSRREDDRAVRRRIAWGVGIANGIGIAAAWWILGGQDPAIVAHGMSIRLVMAGLLTGMCSIAIMGIALIGLDARFIGPA
jgi:hypothetical protein